MDLAQFDKILFSRKLQVILFAICLIGLIDAANHGSGYNAYIFLLLLGLLSSIFTIVVKTLMSGKRE